MKRIVLTGGGTAGHVTPHLALLPHLKAQGYEIHYIGTKNGIEHSMIGAIDGITYHCVQSGKLRRYFDWKNFTDPFRVIWGAFQSAYLIGKIKPDVCFSKGGFVSVPVVIGSCTNGRMEDMETAYKILNGKKVADGVRCIIIPGTMQILRECVEKGYYTAFIDAGAVVSTPTCGPCLGGYMGILAAGERCVATTNRNFVGRMGHTESEVYLASPATAAASALTGYITHPKEV